MSKLYKVIAECNYKDRSTKYVCGVFKTKKATMKFLNEECYNTSTKSHYIEIENKD
jgi:hypothetical protein